MTKKEQLRRKGKSLRSIASDLHLNHSVIIQVLDGKYLGSKETIKKVTDYVDLILIDKVDLNPVIYTNIDTFIKVVQYAIRKAGFSDDEVLLLVDLVMKLKQHKKYLEENNHRTNDKERN